MAKKGTEEMPIPEYALFIVIAHIFVSQIYRAAESSVACLGTWTAPNAPAMEPAAAAVSAMGIRSGVILGIRNRNFLCTSAAPHASVMEPAAAAMMAYSIFHPLNTAGLRTFFCIY